MGERVENQAGRGRRKLAWLVGLATAVVVFGVAGLVLLQTDKVKADLTAATQKASTAMASGQYAQAREILEQAIAAVPQDRPDRPQLIAEPLRLLNSVNALAATTGSAPGGTIQILPGGPLATGPALSPQEQQKVADQSQQAHQQSAQIALADLRSLVAQKDFTQARDLARQAVKEYADTDSAKEFADLLVEAQQGLAVQQVEDARRQEADQASTEAQQQERHGRFLEYRDAGIDAFNRRDYRAAVLMLQNAVNEEQAPQTQALLEQALDKTTRPRIAVADFTVSGNVGIPEAGKSVAELLLTKFDPARFQLVERSHLASILDEQNLTVAQLVDNPAVMQGKKLKGVKYIVLGTVVRLGTLAVSARLVNVATGEIAQTAEIYADDSSGLQQGLGELAAILQMSSEEKRAYLEDRRMDMDRQAQAAAQVAADAQAQEQARREAEIRYRRWQQAEAARRQQHEQAAVLAMAAIKSLLAQGNFPMASSYSHRAVEDFADTRYAREFTDLLALSDGQLAAQQAAQAEQATRDRQRQELEQREHRRRFVEFRDQGLAALNAKDYPAAISSFRSALKEQDDRDVARLLAQAQALQKTDAERDNLLDRQYDDWMAKGKTAEREKRWPDALTAYQKARDIKSTPEARSGIQRAQDKLNTSGGTPTRPGPGGGTTTRPSTGDTTTRPSTGGGTAPRPGAGGADTDATRPSSGTGTTTRTRPGTTPRPTTPPATPPTTRPAPRPTTPPTTPATTPPTTRPTAPPTTPATTRPAPRPTAPPANPPGETAPKPGSATPATRPEPTSRPTPASRPVIRPAQPTTAAKPDSPAKPTVKPTPAGPPVVPVRPVVRRERPTSSEKPATPPPASPAGALVKLAPEPASQPTTTSQPSSTDKADKKSDDKKK